MRLMHLTTTALLALSLAVPAHAAASAADLYSAALAREQAVRARLDPGRHPTPAVLRQVRAAVHAYEAVVLRYPRSGYCDNALWRGAQLASDAFTFFGEARDRATAVRLIHWLQKQYPHSRYAHMAPSAPAPARKAAARTPAPRTAPEREARPTVPVEAARRPTPAPPTHAAPPAAPPAAALRTVTRMAADGRVRVTLELDREALYTERRSVDPNRLVLDFQQTRPAASLKPADVVYRSAAVVRRITVHRAGADRTEVALDLGTAAPSSCGTFALYKPYRLVIDCAAAPAAASRRPGTSTARPAARPLQRAPAPAPAAPGALLESSRMIEATVTSLPTAVSSRPAPPVPVPTRAAAAPVSRAALESPTVSPYPVPGGDTAPAPPAKPRHAPVAARAASTAPAGPADATATGTVGAATAAAALLADTASDGHASRATDSSASSAPAAAHEAPTRPPATNLDGGFSMARQLGLGVSRIVIDPGHGGRDPGAQANGITEANLVLDIALRLEKLLKKQPGIQVILTRRTNVYVPLEERTAIANRAGADLFLSIHANASRNAQAHGIETYFLNFASNAEESAVAARENATSGDTMGSLPDLVKAIALNNKLDESRDFATMIQHAMYTELRQKNADAKNLGVKQAPFAVLIGASMPSVLAEVSFLTNKHDARYLKRGSYQEQIAEALLDGILRYQHALKNVRTADNQEAAVGGSRDWGFGIGGADEASPSESQRDVAVRGLAVEFVAGSQLVIPDEEPAQHEPQQRCPDDDRYRETGRAEQHLAKTHRLGRRWREVHDDRVLKREQHDGLILLRRGRLYCPCSFHPSASSASCASVRTAAPVGPFG